jgi:hypothetical protein
MMSSNEFPTVEVNPVLTQSVLDHLSGLIQDDNSDENNAEEDVNGDVFNAADEIMRLPSSSRPREVSTQLEFEQQSVSNCDHSKQLPSVVVKNNCGEDIVVALYVNSAQPSAFTTCVANAQKIGTVVAPAQNSSRLYTPWTTIYDTYDGPVFPIVTFTMSMRDGNSYSASPTPLHTLSSRPLFLTRHFVDGYVCLFVGVSFLCEFANFCGHAGRTSKGLTSCPWVLFSFPQWS